MRFKMLGTTNWATMGICTLSYSLIINLLSTQADSMQVFFRTHYTNARLAKIYPAVSDAYGRCDYSPANHVHMFWSCVKLGSFWSYIFDTLSRAYGYVIAPNSLSAVFGIAPLTGAPKNLKQALAFTTLLARPLISSIGNSPILLHALAGLLRCSTTWNLKNSGLH